MCVGCREIQREMERERESDGMARGEDKVMCDGIAVLVKHQIPQHVKKETST